MPTIRDLLGGPDPAPGEGEEPDFDLDKMLSEVDQVLAARHAGDPADPPAPPEPAATDPAAGAEPPEPTGTQAPTEPVAPAPGAPAEPPPHAAVTPPEADPLAQLPPERRAALLELDRTLMADPSKREQIARVILGVAPAPAPTEPPAPKLPADMDPESVEARLWLDNQDLRQHLARIEASQGEVAKSVAEQRQLTVAHQHAQAAGQAFATRYAGKLAPEEVLDIARRAGQGTAGAFAAAPQFAGNLQGAYEEAMEHVLWRDPELRAKVTGDAPPVAPGPSPQAAADDRKRKLTALSTAASPVSAPAASPPLESRTDGRLTDQSRRTVVEQAAAALRRHREGT